MDIFDKCYTFDAAKEAKEKGSVPLLHPHPGEPRHACRHRRQRAHHGGLQQLPRPFVGSPGEGSRHRGHEDVGHQLLGFAVSQRHARRCTRSWRRAWPISSGGRAPCASARATRPTSAPSPRSSGRTSMCSPTSSTTPPSWTACSLPRACGAGARAPLPAQQHGKPGEVPRRGAEDAPKLVVTDGVFSMEGDIVKLPRMKELCTQVWRPAVPGRGARAGRARATRGRGTEEHYGVTDLPTSSCARFPSRSGPWAGSSPVTTMSSTTSSTWPAR